MSGAIVGSLSPSILLRRLLPASASAAASTAATSTVQEILDELAVQLAAGAERASAAGRPLVLLNMASTADGRASVGGRSGPIGDEADSELLHGLRTLADAILVGAGTARAERYARLLRDGAEIQQRLRRGLSAQPLACIASESLALESTSVPLLAEPQAKVAILTPSDGTIPESAASVSYVRSAREGRLDLADALAELHEDHGVRTLLCEGGPGLAADLIAADLADELFLCLAPKLAGGRGELRITSGAELAPPRRMRLASLHEHDSYLFLRYELGSGEG